MTVMLLSLGAVLATAAAKKTVVQRSAEELFGEGPAAGEEAAMLLPVFASGRVAPLDTCLACCDIP
jgi:hypothetical protein